MSHERILHITTQEAWDEGKTKGEYKTESLESEGFIHMSTKEQTPGTLNLWFKQATELLLLHIDPSKLISKLVFEAPVGPHTETTNKFPHLYGPLCIDAVIHTQPISRASTNDPWSIDIDDK